MHTHITHSRIYIVMPRGLSIVALVAPVNARTPPVVPPPPRQPHQGARDGAAPETYNLAIQSAAPPVHHHQYRPVLLIARIHISLIPVQRKYIETRPFSRLSRRRECASVVVRVFPREETLPAHQQVNRPMR